MRSVCNTTRFDLNGRVLTESKLKRLMRMSNGVKRKLRGRSYDNECYGGNSSGVTAHPKPPVSNILFITAVNHIRNNGITTV